jgi:ribosomal protein S18 acetylase RimI-like enzyme
VAEVAIRSARAEDVEPTYELIAACQIALFGKPDYTLEHLRNTWDLWTGFTAWEAGRLVGTSAVWDDNLAVFVHPERRRRGIGTRLLEPAERAAPLGILQADAVTLERAAAPFLRANGYEKAWDIWLMGLDLEGVPAAPRWPDDLEVRTFRDEDAPVVKDLLDRAYAADPDYRPVPLEEWQRIMTGDVSFDPAVWFLAEEGGVLAGAALCWKEGYVKDLVVDPDRRKRGLGEALMRQVFRAFGERGVRSVTLKTDSKNPTRAWRLYERLGMRVERTYEVFEKRLGPVS